MKPIRSSAREIVFKVYKRCLAECEENTILSDLNNVYQRTADMTGISVSTIRRLVREGVQNGGAFLNTRETQTKKDLDNFDLCAIRQKFQIFYTVRKQVPTLHNLLPVVRKDLGFNGSREHLGIVLRVLGFKEDCPNYLSRFFDQKSQNFYSNGIMLLPTR